MNDAQTRIANCLRWVRREDVQAMLRSDEMRARNREIAELCTRFEPVMYEGERCLGNVWGLGAVL